MPSMVQSRLQESVAAKNYLRCYSLLTAHCSLLTTHYSRLTTHYSLLTTHYSLLTTYYSLLTTHYSLLTTYYAGEHRCQERCRARARWHAV
jgi:hypothetical protein